MTRDTAAAGRGSLELHPGIIRPDGFISAPAKVQLVQFQLWCCDGRWMHPVPPETLGAVGHHVPCTPPSSHTASHSGVFPNPPFVITKK